VPQLNFEDTKTAFAYKSDAQLKSAKNILMLWQKPWLVNIGNKIVLFGLKLHFPMQFLTPDSAFEQFVGGESLKSCESTINTLAEHKVGAILDYSVEALKSESGFNASAREIMDTIDQGADNDAIPFSVFKITGLGRIRVLTEVSRKTKLSQKQKNAYRRIRFRVRAICEHASLKGVRILIDAEESWFQNVIDKLAMDMMAAHNKTIPIVYNTYQLYRHDVLNLLKTHHEEAKEKGFILAAKLVRGAYMEKERERAEEEGYPSPIQATKEDTDRDYDSALKYCAENIDSIAVMVGTHNEQSTKLFAELMEEYDIPHDHPHVHFAQLWGMSDNLTFNLAKHVYNVAKYVPYGPFKKVLPYLMRRASENTSIAGQMSRELTLISNELTRRKTEEPA
jgi:proline dehydrogenase